MYNPQKYPYKDFVTPHFQKFAKICLSDDDLKEINKLAEERVKAKMGEYHHKIDGGSEMKRNITGLKGEFAVEKLTGLKIVDRTVGNSCKYNKPDIEEYGVGIKSVTNGDYPVIFRDNSYPQIICICSNRCENNVAVCGLATEDVLDKYQSD